MLGGMGIQGTLFIKLLFYSRDLPLPPSASSNAHQIIWVPYTHPQAVLTFRLAILTYRDPDCRQFYWMKKFNYIFLKQKYTEIIHKFTNITCGTCISLIKFKIKCKFQKYLWWECGQIWTHSWEQSYVMPVKTIKWQVKELCTNQLKKPLHIAPTDYQVWDSALSKCFKCFYFDLLVANEFGSICCLGGRSFRKASTHVFQYRMKHNLTAISFKWLSSSPI